ncbi:uncharacterized protein L969DRAFT_19525 [Mixia osmundae IAM 14324]|uniref:Uncharacterized protein n=1 Tax=Mixia osmundae (strain CBS 9802 / IAM 14324 / JCM 22182 / KY 12970) TaxID=764103 RepID=G7DUQ1_MIXOS|nr:uncharacterized protein L969DRAFT_19525 [Mixia osmundae IAM 14324]KEI37474.1 hypothetical protein L969DRAFT_19525 [Mixia osmundae IAM 14324]GAA94311.1 hypothetical protein E5Q_00960 [Mixia osmundae IAM 14324]
MFLRAVRPVALGARSIANVPGRRHASTQGSPLTLNTEVTGGGAQQKSPFFEEREHIHEHARGAADLWRKISLYVAIPAAVIAYLNVRNLEQEHHEHLEHIKEENGGELPERVVYDFNNIRKKEFPWGRESLFFNPKTNISAAEGEDE